MKTLKNGKNRFLSRFQKLSYEKNIIENLKIQQNASGQPKIIEKRC